MGRRSQQRLSYPPGSCAAKELLIMQGGTQIVVPQIDLSLPWQVLNFGTADRFLQAMAALGPHDLTLVGSFADPDDQDARTAHRDKDLPWHRDGIKSKAIADM